MSQAPALQQPRAVAELDVNVLQQNLLRQAGITVNEPDHRQGHVAYEQGRDGYDTRPVGIPASATYPVLQQNSVYSSHQTYGSPAQSSRHGDGSQGTSVTFSPEAARIINFTEPRNYAPRTNGRPITQEPPPKFGLGIVAHGTDQQLRSQDPFKSGPGSETALSVQSPPPVTAVVPYNQYVPPAAPMAMPPQRSELLSVLTNTPTRLPLLETAMSPTYFPFVEGPRLAHTVNHGVVKLKNVSWLACTMSILTNVE